MAHCPNRFRAGALHASKRDQASTHVHIDVGGFCPLCRRYFRLARLILELGALVKPETISYSTRGLSE